MTLRSSAFRRLLLASSLLAAAPAYAQTAEPAPAAPEVISDDMGDEIVVVARRREERLVDVPIAVTALSADQLAKSQALDISGIQGAVPNVNLVQGRG